MTSAAEARGVALPQSLATKAKECNYAGLLPYCPMPTRATLNYHIFFRRVEMGLGFWRSVGRILRDEVKVFGGQGSDLKETDVWRRDSQSWLSAVPLLDISFTLCTRVVAVKC